MHPTRTRAIGTIKAGLSLLFCFVLTIPLTVDAFAANTAIVTRSGNQFMLQGQPYHYAGFNNYYMMVFAADPGLKPYVDEVLEEGAGLGLTVLRTWAFNDGAGQWNALQTAPGVYQEYVFEGLDYVLDKADSLGIRLILPLVNNWDDYGGMNQYVAWSPTASAHDEFYTDANCRKYYRDHLSMVLNRVNSINGRLYREDPTIFAWELANEPRCHSDSSGDTLQAWVEEMSAYIKNIDSLHMVTTGSEGYYGPTGPAHNPMGWMGGTGVDYIRNHQPSTIDFCCVHVYPDHWGTSYTQSMGWVSDHIIDTDALLGKPLVLEEFGMQQPLATRDLYFQGWYDQLYASAATGGSVGGSNFWILYHDDYPDYDGFGIYDPAHTSTLAIISTEAARMQDLNTTVAPFFTCQPSSGTLPFSTTMTVTLTNLYAGQSRRFSAHPDAALAGGAYYPNWRAGYTNIAGGNSFTTSWSQAIPALGSLVGDNTFTLEVEDVTPAPYNQPPYPASGDTAADSCTVTGLAP